MLNTKKLQQIIKEKGLMHKFIAKKLNMSEQAFCRKLKGQREFKVEEALLLCEILSIKKPAQIFFAKPSDILDK